jgi:hypothetical protein
MSNNNYKIILLGKIIDGFDSAEVKEKLAIVFEKTEKQIEKLLKKGKPVVVRKNLTAEFALRYKEGLEKIGVLCQIEGDEGGDLADFTVAETADVAESFKFKEIQEDLPSVLTLGGGTVRVTAIKIPLGALILFLIKLMLASIPAWIILAFLSLILQQATPMLMEILGATG